MGRGGSPGGSAGRGGGSAGRSGGFSGGSGGRGFSGGSGGSMGGASRGGGSTGGGYRPPGGSMGGSSRGGSGGGYRPPGGSMGGASRGGGSMGGGSRPPGGNMGGRPPGGRPPGGRPPGGNMGGRPPGGRPPGGRPPGGRPPRRMRGPRPVRHRIFLGPRIGLLGPRPPIGRGGLLLGMMFPIFLVIIIAVIAISSFAVVRVGNNTRADYYGYEQTYQSESDGIVRTKLDSDLCIESSYWIDDELGWLDSQSIVKSAMQDFYKETGVQPYLVITDNVDGEGEDLTDAQAEAWMADLYDSLYSDEGHMILAFIEYSPGEYYRYIYTGTSASGVIDASARETILGYVDRYYTEPISDEEYFAQIFTSSADTIMADSVSNTRTRNIIIVILVVGAVLVVVLLLARRAAAAKAKAAEETEKILNTPIGGSPDEEELKRKYSNYPD